MNGDYVSKGQQLVWRSAHRFRRHRAHLKGATRDWDYDRGRKQLADLVEEVESRTGGSVSGRRALDFGCGAGRLALPLAQHCEHVHGLDIDPDVLRLAEQNAASQGITNFSCGLASTLGEWHGRYDLVLSMNVLQHIPSRQGEQTFRALIDGLQPGGIAMIQALIRPPVDPKRLLNRDYVYALMNSYSLTRLGNVLFDGGVSPWSARVRTTQPRDGMRPFEDVILYFQK